MSCGCCQVTLLILLCVALGFLLGIQLAHEFNIHGIQDMWNKFVDLFHKEKDRIAEKLVSHN